MVCWCVCFLFVRVIRFNMFACFVIYGAMVCGLLCVKECFLLITECVFVCDVSCDVECCLCVCVF